MSIVVLDALDVIDHIRDSRLDLRFALRRELFSFVLRSCSPEGHVDARVRENVGPTVDWTFEKPYTARTAAWTSCASATKSSPLSSIGDPNATSTGPG